MLRGLLGLLMVVNDAVPEISVLLGNNGGPSSFIGGARLGWGSIDSHEK